MPLRLSKSASLVQDYLDSKNPNLNIQILCDSTSTAQQAADSLAVELKQIGKSIVFGNEIDTIVAVLCGDNRADINRISTVTKIHTLNLLNAKEVKKRTGFVIGGVSPFALSENIKVVLDARLFKLSHFYVAAGHPKAVVKTCGEDVSKYTNAIIEKIAKK